MAATKTTRSQSKRTRSPKSTSSRARASNVAPRELGLFARFCRDVLTLENGQPLKLEPFQKRFLTEFFSGARETAVLVPKKNGKSTLLGALAIYHLCSTPDAECVIAAASRDQAQIMLRQAQGFIRRSPSLQMRLQVKQREIEHRQLGGRIRVLASDVDTADGVIPTLALVDELHRHKNADLYGVFRDGLGPRQGQLVTISTAGSAIESPLGNLRRRAHELPTYHRKGAYRHAVSADGAFVLHEWALEPDENQADMRLVKKANPASWQTQAELRKRHDSPTMTPWQWARFACGIWTEGEEPWIDPVKWDALNDGRDIEDGSTVWLGVDLGVRHDSTAIAIVYPRGDGHFDCRAEIISPGSDELRIARVEQAVRDLAGKYRVKDVAYDPWSFRRSAQLLADEAIPMGEFPQHPERMAVASANLYRLIDEGKLHHDGNPVLRSHVVAGVTKETNRGWQLVKDPKSKRPIDALIALAMACQIASSPPPPTPFVEVF